MAPMITIAFFSTNQLLSKIIMFFTKSKVSHAAIGMKINGKDMFFHSAAGGVQLTPREKVLSHKKLIHEFEVIPNLDNAINTALDYLGDSYDVVGLMGYIFVLIGRWLKFKVKNPFAKKYAYVCSEFILECDVHKQIPEFKDLDPETITPKDLLQICENGASFKKIL